MSKLTDYLKKQKELRERKAKRKLYHKRVKPDGVKPYRVDRIIGQEIGNTIRQYPRDSSRGLCESRAER